MADRTNLSSDEILQAVSAVRDQATEAAQRLAEQLELERRLRENPMGTLAMAAGAGFVLGGGLWPVLRPFLRATVRTALSPQNLMALAAAAGALRASSARRGEDATDMPPPGEPSPMAH
jgi:hypothetical protein